MARGTRPTQIRLTEQDKAKVEEVRQRYGLPSSASAIRYAIEAVYRQLPPPEKKSKRTLDV